MEDEFDRVLKIIGWGLAFLILIHIYTSCGTCKRCASAMIDKDSIYIERVDSVFYRDTIIQVQMRDSIVKVITSNHQPSHLETDVAISDAWVEDDSLHHVLRNKRELIPIQVQMPMAISTEKHYLTRIVHKKVNELSAMQNFWLILGKFFAVIVGVGVLIWLIKRKI